jgi:hypothetical protein
MKTLVIYFNESKTDFQRITPLGQGPEWNDKTRFDGKWKELAEHIAGNRKLVSYEVI